MTDAKYLGVGVLVTMLATLAAASSAQGQVPEYDAWFSQAVSTDWNDINNWEAQQTPDPNRTAVIGITRLYENVTCVIPTGTNPEIGGLEIGRYTNSSLTIEAGASLHVTTSDTWVSYSGNDSYTNTLNVYGSLTADGGMQVAGKASANLTVAASATVTSNGSFNVGMEDHMGGTSSPYGYAYTIDHSGLITVGAGGRGYYITGDIGVAILYQLNGSTINALGLDPNTGFGYWHMGGTVEVTGDSVLNATNPAIMAGGPLDGPPASLWTTPILKFSGTNTTLTVNGDVYCRWLDTGTMLTDPNCDPVQLDVSDLTMIKYGIWLTIIDANSITDGDQLGFVPGTNPNWELQVVGGQVQVRFPQLWFLLMGDCNRSGYVDDDDLSLLLANWHATTTWDYGNLSDNDEPPGVMGYVDDDDLSLLLANWQAGDPGMAGAVVPEPATIAALLLGALASVCRKRK